MVEVEVTAVRVAATGDLARKDYARQECSSGQRERSLRRGNAQQKDWWDGLDGRFACAQANDGRVSLEVFGESETRKERGVSSAKERRVTKDSSSETGDG